jgi:hypothetical protein
MPHPQLPTLPGPLSPLAPPLPVALVAAAPPSPLAVDDVAPAPVPVPAPAPVAPLALDPPLPPAPVVLAPLLLPLLLDDAPPAPLPLALLLLALLAVVLAAPHAPLWHVPPGHGVPSGSAGFEHPPPGAAHVPAAWHASIAAHTIGLLPTHAPALHESTWVHALPSSQSAPFGFCGFEQPTCGSQRPAMWHWSMAAQTTLGPGKQNALMQ